MVISFYTSQILVAICSLDDGTIIIGRSRHRRCRHSILLTFVCVYFVVAKPISSHGLLFARYASVYFDFVVVIHLSVHLCLLLLPFLRETHAKNLHIKQYTHIHTQTDRASLFLGIFVHLIPLCLVPPNSQLVLYAFFYLSFCCWCYCCCCHVWQHRLLFYSHMYLKLILMGAPAMLLLLLLCYFILSFTFVLFLLLFVATLAHLSRNLFLLKNRVRHTQVDDIEIHACWFAHTMPPIHTVFLSFARNWTDANYVQFNHQWAEESPIDNATTIVF